LVALIISRVV